ncbi:MAG TPA: CPBP family intramembrane glutamic endopeptidase [Sedimentisphaerales bacterium]|nr:CPBP family intramembrane glutamic endopeptidase [Sedimentisphaerales bacterium]
MAKAKNSSSSRIKQSKSQLFNFARDSYLERTSRPICAIVFLLPFILFYEIGTFRINTDVLNQSQIRVVAFVWLQNLLESLGFGGKFAWAAPPLAVVVILLALQIASGKQWRLWLGDLLPMAAECVLLAVPLIVLTLFLNSSPGAQSRGTSFDGDWPSAQREYAATCSSTAGQTPSAPGGAAIRGTANRFLLADVVTGIGAGIYEELVFRLILICLLMLLFQDALRLSHKSAAILSVLISAALFSAHHHVDFLTGQPNLIDPFNVTRFAFRTIAGIYFAALFAIRGFGITAGTHASYNIIAVSITVHFFPP